MRNPHPLSAHYPQIAEEWHPSKNGRLTPADVSYGSKKKVWWRCSQHPEHEWEMPVYRRTGKFTPYCPVCVSFGFQHPERARFFDTTKNECTVYDFRPHSNKKYWWQCPKAASHSWQARPGKILRPESDPCPYCNGKAVCAENSLAFCRPDIAAEWHPTKNKKVTPWDRTPGSSKKAFWVCAKGHSYETRIKARTYRNSGCPLCKNKVSRPETYLFSELKWIFDNAISNYQKNQYRIDIYLPDYNIGFEYDGYYYHKDRIKQDRLRNRSMSMDGITIIRMREPGLDKIAPQDILIKKGEKNQALTLLALQQLKKLNKSASTNERLNNYLAQGKRKNIKLYREILANASVPEENSLAYLVPSSLEDWDYEENAPLTPFIVTKGQHDKVYWRCAKNSKHPSFSMAINNYVNGNRCPICAGKQVTKDQSLAIKRPDLAAEWDYDLNIGLTPSDFSVGSEIIVAWECKNGHKWRQSIALRNARKDPTCNVCRSVAFKFPNLLKEFDPKLNPGLSLWELTCGSRQKIMWTCKANPEHKWSTAIYTRARVKCPSGCPDCYNESRTTG